MVTAADSRRKTFPLHIFTGGGQSRSNLSFEFYADTKKPATGVAGFFYLAVNHQALILATANWRRKISKPAKLNTTSNAVTASSGTELLFDEPSV